MDNTPQIILVQLADGHPALTPSAGLNLAEAAAVCLADQRHGMETLLSISGEFAGIYSLRRFDVTEQMRLCYNDPEEATELGACGIAILVMWKTTGLRVVERSRKDTGFDYWLGTEDAAPFQNKARLEVSGIRVGDTSIIQSRVRRKLRQVQRSGSGFPVYIVVVEFSRPIVQVVKR